MSESIKHYPFINRRIAKLLGYRHTAANLWHTAEDKLVGTHFALPNYCRSRDAMEKAIEFAKKDGRIVRFYHELEAILVREGCVGTMAEMVTATALMEAEAFLRTYDRWDEEASITGKVASDAKRQYKSGVRWRTNRFHSPENQCPQCHGFGAVFAAFQPMAFTCDLCQGRGVVSDKTLHWRKLGEILKERRRNARLTMKEAAKLIQVECLYLSQMERGLVKPVPFDFSAATQPQTATK